MIQLQFNTAINAQVISAIAHRLGFEPDAADNHDEHSVTLALMKFLYETHRAELGFDFTALAVAAAAAAAGGGGGFNFTPNIHVQPPTVNVTAPIVNVAAPTYAPDPAELARKNNVDNVVVETAKRMYQSSPDNPNLDDESMMADCLEKSCSGTGRHCQGRRQGCHYRAPVPDACVETGGVLELPDDGELGADVSDDVPLLRQDDAAARARALQRGRRGRRRPRDSRHPQRADLARCLLRSLCRRERALLRAPVDRAPPGARV